jgi:hypothetical protein
MEWALDLNKSQQVSTLEIVGIRLGKHDMWMTRKFRVESTIYTWFSNKYIHCPPFTSEISQLLLMKPEGKWLQKASVSGIYGDYI